MFRTLVRLDEQLAYLKRRPARQCDVRVYTGLEYVRVTKKAAIELLEKTADKLSRSEAWDGALSHYRLETGSIIFLTYLSHF